METVHRSQETSNSKHGPFGATRKIPAGHITLQNLLNLYSNVTIQEYG